MTRTLTALLVAALALAACAGDGGEASATTTTTIAPITTLPPEPTTTTLPETTTTTITDVPPTVALVPADREVVEAYEQVVEGSTTPGTTVTVNGEAVEVAGDGTFAVTLFNTPGDNVLTVVATGETGLTTEVVSTYTFEPADGWAAGIGDSVMLGSKDEIEKRLGPGVVDATVSRQFLHAPDLVRELLARTDPPEVIIIGLGTNGPVQARHFDEVMEVASDVPLVAFVNVRVPRNWEDTSNRELAEGVERYDNAVLVDWWTPTHDRDDLFAADGFHPKQPGRVIMAELIAEAIFPNWMPLDG